MMAPNPRVIPQRLNYMRDPGFRLLIGETRVLCVASVSDGSWDDNCGSGPVSIQVPLLSLPSDCEKCGY